MHPHAVMAAGHAVRGAITLVSQRMDHKHTQTILKFQTSVTELLATKAATLRSAQLEAIHESCQFLLGMLSEQARHYMSEQAKDAEEYRKEREDPMRRLQLESSIRRIDERLRDIREAALLLHSTTGDLLLRVGQTSGHATPGALPPLPAQLVKE